MSFLVKAAAVIGIPLGVMLAMLVYGGVMLVTGSQWLLVKVDTAGEDEVHLIVPVPVDLVRGAAAFMPDECREMKLTAEELPFRTENLDKLAKALAEAPDGEYVNVETPAEKVRIAKAGSKFEIQVKTPEERINVVLPVEFIGDCLHSLEGGRIDSERMLHSLAYLRHTKVVDVDTPDAKVVVYSW